MFVIFRSSKLLQFSNKMNILEDIRVKKEKTGNVLEEVNRNKNSGGPYQTLKPKRPILGKVLYEELNND